MDKLYSASEARARLGGMSSSSFKRLVDTGKIRKVTPPNKVQGMYMKEDVDKLAEAMQEFVEIYSTIPTGKFEVIRARNEDDIRATAQIAKQHFGDLAYTAEDRLPWFRKVPDGDFILLHDGVIVGYFSIQAVQHEALEDHILKPKGGGVRLEDIIPFSPNAPLECYVTGMAVKLEPNHQTNKHYGMLLILGLGNALVEFGRRGVDIHKIWTKSRTVSGIKICREVGFKDLGYLDSEHILFMLDLQTATFPLIQRYREALNTAKEASDHQTKAYIKSDSKTERKPRTMRDTSGQNGTERKTPTRSTSHSTKD
jgi:hypothetical protein